VGDARRDGVDIPTQLAERSRDVAIAALATRQHGVVARRQLTALGLNKSAIAHRVHAGRLHRVHRAVYAVGHFLMTTRGRWMAAALACAPRAWVGHAAAAALWDLRASQASTIDVLVLSAAGRARHPGLRIHRVPSLRPGEVTVHEGIPVTTPGRTLLDLAAMRPPRELERALDRAEMLRIVDMRALDAVLRAHPCQPGTARLRRVLGRHAAGRRSREACWRSACSRCAAPWPGAERHGATT
jgi:predicted transcriptional regulator of viral defense system